MPRRGDFKTLVAVTRGGLVPAALIARKMDIHYVDTICISSYNGQQQGTLNIIKNLPGTGDGCLVVDDLVDSGLTAKAVRQMLPKAFFVALYAKPQGKPFADLTMMDMPQDTWLHFPWE